MTRIVRSISLLAYALACAWVATAAQAATFQEDLELIEEALRRNPHRVLPASLDACREHRREAAKAYAMGMEGQAREELDRCFEALQIPPGATMDDVTAITPEAFEAAADEEYRAALALTGDPDRGLELFRACAACHRPEGWGQPLSGVPQIAGQHATVIMRQLADFRAGHRDSVVMTPFASSDAVPDAQAIADVAAYVTALPMTAENGKGPGAELDFGRTLYAESCADCHGADGAGRGEDLIPRLQAQHFGYLERQFAWIRDGRRGNAHPEMVARIQGWLEDDVTAVLDFVSRLPPPEALRAPPGWENPDFE